MDAERTDAHAQYQQASHDSKVAKRRANEEYMDKLGIAFAEYNKERVANGDCPVFYDYRRGTIDERKAGYDENGWPEEPKPEAEK